MLIDGVVKIVLPERSKTPPEDKLYQSIVSPEAGVAEIVTVPVPHIALSPAAGADGIVPHNIVLVLVALLHPLVPVRVSVAVNEPLATVGVNVAEAAVAF